MFCLTANINIKDAVYIPERNTIATNMLSQYKIRVFKKNT